MLRPSLPALLCDLLLRPAHLAACGARHPGTTARLALLALGTVACTAGLLALLGTRIPLDAPALIAGPGLALPLAMVAALPLFFNLPFDLPLAARLILSLTRAIVAVGAPAAVGLTLAFSSAFPGLQNDPLVGLLAAVLMGVWAGGSLTAALSVSPRRAEAGPLRWVGAAGALLLGGLIWWSEPLRRTEALALAPLLAGLGLGLLRPLSYLWEALLSAALAVAARLGARPGPLLAWHPATFDELCLIPLPGLAALLARACETRVSEGGPWLVRVAAHPAQAGAACSALDRLLDRGRAHPTLRWLSIDAEGAAWLRQLADGVRRPHPLVAAYAALASVDNLAAWPAAIAAHRSAIAAAADLPGGASLQALVEMGAQTLAADRWQAATRALRFAAPDQEAASDPLWEALAALRAWADQPDGARASAPLPDRFGALDGWPARLLDAMAEHLAYLLAVERQRGSSLVC